MNTAKLKSRREAKKTRLLRGSAAGATIATACAAGILSLSCVLGVIVSATATAGTVKPMKAAKASDALEAIAEIITEETEAKTETEAETEPVAEPTETETETAETEPPVIYYDVPLSEDLQDHIFETCDKYGIEPALVLSIIYHESRYTADAIGDSGASLGLMQIKEHYHRDRMEHLDCEDLFNPYDNISVGVDFLAELIEKYDGDVEMALVAYNCGNSGANIKYFSKGEYSSPYSKAVMNKCKELREQR